MTGRLRLLAVTLAVSGVLAALNLVGIVRFQLHRAFEGDFALYYAFARIGLHHGWSHLYDLAAQRLEWDAVGPLLWYPAPYTPPLGWFVAPFASLAFAPALAAWTAMLFALLLLTWWLAAPGNRFERATHLAVALALFPVAFAILLGQVVIVVAAGIAFAWWLLRHDHHVLAGLALAVVALKPHIAALCPLVLLAAGYRRAFTSWLLASAVIACAGVLSLGPQGLAQYAGRLSLVSHSLTDFKVIVSLTLPGLLGSGWLAYAVQAAVAGFTLFLAWRWRRQGPGLPLVAGVTGSLLITPFVHAQDLALLVVASWLYLRARPPRRQLAIAAAVYLATMLLAVPALLVLLEGMWALALLPPAALSRLSQRNRAVGAV